MQILITLVMTMILAAVLLALVLTGPLAEAIGDELGIGDTALTLFAIAKWPILFAMVVVVIGLLYRWSPHTSHEGLRWILPGSALATGVWLLASAGFSLYVANFGSYANTYGSLAGVIVFLIWLWLTNIAVIFGAQFARELERTAAAATHSPDEPAARPVERARAAFSPLPSSPSADRRRPCDRRSKSDRRSLAGRLRPSAAATPATATVNSGKRFAPSGPLTNLSFNE